MEVNEKLVKIFLLICLPLVTCELLSVTETSLATSHSPAFYVNGLISDYNRKHPGTNQIVVLNIGKKSDLWENVIKVIPKDNPMIIVDPKQCKLIEKRKAEFVVIVSDMFERVSYVNRLIFTCSYILKNKKSEKLCNVFSRMD
jgi:hypothetical protein